MNNTAEQLDLTDTGRKLYPTTAEDVWLSAHGTFFPMDHDGRPQKF